MKNLEKFCYPMSLKRAFLILLLILGFNNLKSQIFLNEFSTSGNAFAGPPTSTLSTASDDWVELYNNWSLPNSLAGYYLSDDPKDLYKWPCPNLTMPAYSYTLIYCDGRNKTENTAAGPVYHTNFHFLQCKSQWLILSQNGAIKDSVYVGRMKPGNSRGRFPDGANAPAGFPKFRVLTPPSPNATNNPSTWFIDYSPVVTFSTAPGYTAPTTGYYEMWVTDTANFAINYTIDGRVPCITYGGCPGVAPAPVTYSYTDYLLTPIPPQGTTTVIRAISFPKPSSPLAGLYAPSFIETNTYFEGPDQTNVTDKVGVLSVCMDTAFFRTAASQTIHVEYFDKRNFWSEASGVVAKPINDGWVNMQRGFDLTLIDEMGDGCAVQGQVFNDATLGTSTRTFMVNFEVRAAGKDNFTLNTPTTTTQPPPSGTHMRDAFVQSFANQIGLNLDYLHYKPVRCYFNGYYLGIYEFRELPDWQYAKHYYGIDRDSSEILAEHAGPLVLNSSVAYSDTGWVTQPMNNNAANTGVFNYVLAKPVFLKGNPYYPQLMKRLDKASFMDFFIYNSYLLNIDLFGLNNAWWRGLSPNSSKEKKWRYFMWDMNNTLNLASPIASIATPTSPSQMSVTACAYIRPPSLTTSTHNTSTFAPYNTAASAYASHNYIFSRLNQNQEFKNEYLNRYMDLLNTSLRCDRMLAQFNYIKTILDPEMDDHCLVWGVQKSDWITNCDTLAIRIAERCAKIRSALTHSTQCYNLQGPYNITLDVKPADAGTINFNSLKIASFTWSGDYYQAKTATQYLYTYMKAIPVDTSQYVFDHWEWTSLTNSTTATPTDKTQYTNYLNSDSVSFNIIESDKITAVFAEKAKDITMPTGFTPNGDGYNDLLLPLGAAVRYSRNYEFQIWNRWGQEIFRTTDSSQGWDGKIGGTEAQIGVYAYVIKYKNVQNEDKIIKGNITLVR
jgi:gliding motility-associated-like protein